MDDKIIISTRFIIQLIKTSWFKKYSSCIFTTRYINIYIDCIELSEKLINWNIVLLLELFKNV